MLFLSFCFYDRGWFLHHTLKYTQVTSTSKHKCRGTLNHFFKCQMHSRAPSGAWKTNNELEQKKRTLAWVIFSSCTQATATYPDFWQERRSAAFGSLPCSDEQHPVTFWCHRLCWLWTLPDPVKHHTRHPIRMRWLVMGWAVLYDVLLDLLLLLELSLTFTAPLTIFACKMFVWKFFPLILLLFFITKI